MLIVDKTNCTGCSACMSICPTGAIEMSPDERGFLYPSINNSKCVDCHQCEKVCMAMDHSSNFNETCDYYIAQLQDENELQHCQSGGASYAFGKACLEMGGVVFGAQYEHCKVAHKRVDSKSELFNTCGSKYVQSDLRTCFHEVRSELSRDIPVLFTGTSCQVDGLYRYLNAAKISVKNLYTVDIICHGVPSPLVLEDYVSLIEKKYKCKIDSINMRDRRFAPATQTVLKSADGKELYDDSYIDLFYSNMALRDSCEYCQFARRSNPADVTIGDVFGLSDKYKDKIEPCNPSSIVIVHSLKGEMILDKADLKKTKIEHDCFWQANLEHPTVMSKRKSDFWRSYQKKGAEYAYKHYTCMGGLFTKLRRKMYRLIGKW